MVCCHWLKCGINRRDALLNPFTEVGSAAFTAAQLNIVPPQDYPKGSVLAVNDL